MWRNRFAIANGVIVVVVFLAKIMTLGLLLWGLISFGSYSSDHSVDFVELVTFLIFLLGIGINYAALQTATDRRSFLDVLSNVWPFIVFKRFTIQERQKIKDLEK